MFTFQIKSFVNCDPSTPAFFIMRIVMYLKSNDIVLHRLLTISALHSTAGAVYSSVMGSGVTSVKWF